MTLSLLLCARKKLLQSHPKHRAREPFPGQPETARLQLALRRIVLRPTALRDHGANPPVHSVLDWVEDRGEEDEERLVNTTACKRLFSLGCVRHTWRCVPGEKRRRLPSSRRRSS